MAHASLIPTVRLPSALLTHDHHLPAELLSQGSMSLTPSPFDQLPTPLGKHAIPLDEVGVNNVAWSSHHAFEVLQHLLKMGYGVLGGDVYEYQHGGLSLTYDNWSCDQNPGEPTSEYARRSVAAATGYIQTHASSRPKDCCYALVVGPAGRD